MGYKNTAFGTKHKQGLKMKATVGEKEHVASGKINILLHKFFN